MSCLEANPYVALAPLMVSPCPAEVVAGSSLLAAFGQRKAFRDPAEVAYHEYAFFTGHTYFFELVGMQLLGAMIAEVDAPDAVLALSDQAVDEARHVEVYARVLGTLPDLMEQDAATVLQRAFVREGTLEEKLVRAFVVLESLAMGLFSARARHFGHTKLCRVDRQVLLEESRHQTHGLELLAQAVVEGRVSMAEVLEITRQTMETVGQILSPAPLLEAFDIEPEAEAIAAIQARGVVGAQRTVTRRCVKHAIRRLRKATKGQPSCTLQ